MQILEHGQAQDRTLLFFPCTAEPVWAFADTISLLSQRWHVFQVVYDGHQPEYPGDFTSVEQTVDEVISYLRSHGVSRLGGAHGAAIGRADAAVKAFLYVVLYFFRLRQHIRENGILRLVKAVVGHTDHMKIPLQQRKHMAKIPLPMAAGAGQKENNGLCFIPKAIKFHLVSPFLPKVRCR